ncbi:MAG: tetratricopeptide repeat protein [Gemmatimonadota bacterium]
MSGPHFGSPHTRTRGVLAGIVSLGVLGLPSAIFAQGDDPRGPYVSAFGHLESGSYEDAIREYESILDGNAGATRSRIDLMTALVALGRHEDAIAVGRAAPESQPVANATGEALLRLGRLDEAAQAFREGANGGPFALTAEVNLAELHFMRGDIDEAMERFDRFIDVYNGTDGNLSSRDLIAVGRAVTYLGRNDPGLFQDAIRAFVEAEGTRETQAETYVRQGFLYLDKYDSPSAKTYFEQVLQTNPRHPDALLGLGEALIFDGAPDAAQVIDRLLDVNEDHVRAKALTATRLLRTETYEAARETALEALDINPNSLEALTALAGSYLVEGDLTRFAETRSRALDINPAYASLDIAMAEMSVQTRRYAQAVERASSAVALDPRAWEGWGLLGMNQLRIGQIEDGRASLERAFDGDPYNPWFKNNLDLLDTFERYETHTTEHFELFIHGQEAELLAVYLAPIAEEAFDSLSRRYGMEPELPVRAELFPNSGDFSVRTLGEVGLGALGVSFGRVLVMDSPTARELGEYNWASVFWHELAHTFHLALSDNRVPRWFSEGLAVHEQRQARPGWGHQANIPFLRALKEGRLKAFSELDDGFMRPDYPAQVSFSYLQASLFFQMVEERHGFAAIRSMLAEYATGAATEDLVTRILDTSMDALDDDFADYLDDRFATEMAGLDNDQPLPDPGAGIATWETYVAANPGSLVARMQLATQLFRDERPDAAEEHFEAALEIFPTYSGPDSPHWYLAAIHRDRGDLDLAVASLGRLTDLAESNYAALLQKADLLEELDRPEESAAALDRAVLIWPYDISLHEKLAELHTTNGSFARAATERRAVVSLDPADRAEALYLLARAEFDSGNARSARRSVMGALEIAPNYVEALELLLEIRGSSQ